MFLITFKEKEKRVVKLLDFSVISNFLESVTFHREMFGVTNFYLYCLCDNFHQQICCKIVQDIFDVHY